MSAREFNFDGIVGPTHNYAGLSHGNVASESHRNQTSSPRQAALQGLAKMRAVASLGIGQCVLPPLPRPHLKFLRDVGFSGTDAQVLESAWREDPLWLNIAYSASSMWTANAATVSPSTDTSDGRLHLTPANLATNLHRSIEAATTTRVLRTIFADPDLFAVHEPLPPSMALMDEGAANHTRLSAAHGSSGVETFVYGVRQLEPDSPKPLRYPARQTWEASRSVARRHGLADQRTVFMQQTPQAIDAGVFHNDVISVGNEYVLLCHELAFVDQPEALRSLSATFEEVCGRPLIIIELSDRELPLADAVASYLFNSQLLTRPDGNMTLLCPSDVEATPTALAATRRILQDANPIDEVLFRDLRQSMNNGGGPACLRLRVVLDQRQFDAIHPGVRFDDGLHQRLVDWVNRHYRDELAPDDLRDPKLMTESFDAIHDLCGILKMDPAVLFHAATIQ